MSQRNINAQSIPIVSDERMRNDLRKALYSAIHIERTVTRETLSNDSGVNIYTIDQILSTDVAKHRPIHAHQMLSLAFAAGPRAVNTVLAVIGYVATPLDEGEDVQPMRLVAEAMSDLSAIANAAADNRFDHTETPTVESAADHLIQILTPISSRKVQA